MPKLNIIYKGNSIPVSRDMSIEHARKLFSDLYNACVANKDYLVVSGKNGDVIFIRVSEVVECHIIDDIE